MRKRIEILLWILCLVAIGFVSMTDPWFVENWFRWVMIVAGLIACATIGFLAGVHHGVGLADKQMRGFFDD